LKYVQSLKLFKILKSSKKLKSEKISNLKKCSIFKKFERTDGKNCLKAENQIKPKETKETVENRKNW
jgi:hypothetical protein